MIGKPYENFFLYALFVGYSSTAFAVDTVDITGGGGASAYFANTAGAGTDGLTVRVGYFTTPASVSAYAYNLAWVNNEWNEFGNGTTQTLIGQAGSFDPAPNLSNASAAFRSESLYIISGDNGTLASSTIFGVFSTSTTFSNVNPYLTSTDTSLATAALFGTRNGTTSLNTAAKATAMYWDINGAAGLGGSGTWGNAVGNTTWTAASAGVATSGTHAWGDNTMVGTAGAGLKAVFNGTAGTVTVNGTVQANAGMEFKANGYTVSGGTAVSLTGANAAANTITVDTGVTANFATNITGSNGMTKAGDGILNLNGASVSPDIIITGGTLLVSNTASDINNLTMQGGTLKFADTVNGTFNYGNLVIDGGTNIIDFGNHASGNILNFSSFTYTSGTLSIYNWSGTVHDGGGTDRLIFGDALTANELSNIWFYFDAGTTWWPGRGPTQLGGAGGEVVPVPEPSTWLTGCSILFLIGYIERKRIRNYMKKCFATF